jgi:hypothetical protein
MWRMRSCVASLTPHAAVASLRCASQESDSGSEEEEEAPKGRADAPTRWAKSFGTVTHDPLADTDGVATRLYYYLWRKNAAGRTPTEFRIPDTVSADVATGPRVRKLTRCGVQVVYKYRLPAFWFFSSKQNGQARPARGARRPATLQTLCQPRARPRSRLSAAFGAASAADYEEEAAERGGQQDHRVVHQEKGALEHACVARRPRRH